MPKISLEQKRLEAIRLQLEGKGEPAKLPQTFVNKTPAPIINSGDNGYLKKDLLKILGLSSLAFIAQFVLYFGLTNHLIRLGF